MENITTIILTPTKDNEVNSFKPDDNFNRIAISVQSGSTAIYRTLLQFVTTIPAGNVVTSAKLKLWAYQSSNYPRTHTVSRVIEDWEELGITWNNQPAVTPQNKFSQPVNGVAGMLDVYDVTQLVKDALEVGNVIGIRLMDSIEFDPTTYSYVLWYSKERGGVEPHPPELEVTYGPAVPIYTLTITSTIGGNTDPAPGSYSCDEGTIISVTALAEDGYVFDHWELDGVNVSTTTSYNVTMDADHTLHAVFTPVALRGTLKVHAYTTGV